MITAEKRKVSRTGIAHLGWRMGYGYACKRFTVEKEIWCVLDNGKVIAECRGEKQAKRIVKALEEK